MDVFDHVLGVKTWGLLAVVVTCAGIALVWRLAAIYGRLSQFPGPTSAVFSKIWMIRATISGEMHLKLAQACKEYGSIVRIGPNDLVTSDAEVLRHINALRSPYIRSEWYNCTAFSHNLNHVFCERNEDRHQELRSKLIPGYSGRENEQLEKRIDDRINDLCALIQRKYLSRGSKIAPVDLARICSFFTLDVIHTIALGEPMGFLAKDEDIHGYLANQEAMLPVFEWLSTLPALEKLLRTPWISRNIMPKPTDPTGVGFLLGFAKRVVEAHKDRKQRDMMGSFLEHGLSPKEAEMEAVLQIIAGSDTTATTIRMTLFFLASNPRVYAKLQREIDQAERAGNLSYPVIQYEETQRIPYLEACVKEGLRLWPPVLGLMSKEVPAKGDHINGKFVPGGTNVGYCAWGVHRNREVFGEDADVMRPERWLEASEQQVTQMMKSFDLVFGWGKNACLGKPIAWIEMRKTIAELLRRYDISIVDPEHPFEGANRNGLFVQRNMWVKFEERTKG